jgi:type VI secretion system protein ImpF
MSGAKGRERLQPALLDRLTDSSPTQKNDTPDQRVLTTAQLRQAVVRDLSALFNTTNLATLEDLSGTKLVAASTLNYGIPGFAGMIESPGRRAALEREIAAAIRAFEPRIRPQTLRVRARDARELGVIVFEIAGELWAQPVPVPLFLETAIEVETRLAVVRESKGSR